MKKPGKPKPKRRARKPAALPPVAAARKPATGGAERAVIARAPLPPIRRAQPAFSRVIAVEDRSVFALLLLPFLIVAVALSMTQSRRAPLLTLPTIAERAPVPESVAVAPAPRVAPPAPHVEPRVERLPPAVPQTPTQVTPPAPAVDAVPAPVAAVAPPSPLELPAPAEIATPSAPVVAPVATPADIAAPAIVATPAPPPVARIETPTEIIVAPPAPAPLPLPSPELVAPRVVAEAPAAAPAPAAIVEAPAPTAPEPIPPVAAIAPPPPAPEPTTTVASLDIGRIAPPAMPEATAAPPQAPAAPVPVVPAPVVPAISPAPIASGEGVCLPTPERSAAFSNIGRLARARLLPRAVGLDPDTFGRRLAAAALAQTQDLVIYTARYQPMAYPLGDVLPLYGACIDVIIRAYRTLGIDLQEEIQKGKPRRGDTNIDHRRTENLRRFLERSGASLPITAFPENYKPGDIVTYYRPFSRVSVSHIAIVTDVLAPTGRPMIVHNRGYGPQLEDALFVDRITGHYRYLGPPVAAKATADASTEPSERASQPTKAAEQKPGRLAY